MAARVVQARRVCQYCGHHFEDEADRFLHYQRHDGARDWHSYGFEVNAEGHHPWSKRRALRVR